MTSKTLPRTTLHGKVTSVEPTEPAVLNPANRPSRDTLNGKVVPPRRQTNASVRSREFLTPDEIEAVMKAAGSVGRHRHRDRTMILLAFRHGLRASELVTLRWDQVDLKAGHLHVHRCPSSNKWNRSDVRLSECFAHHFHVTRRIVDSANGVSRWSFV